MRTTTSLIHVLLGLFLSFSACSSSELKDSNAELQAAVESDKILIVYLSRTSNTKAIAEIIHSNVGGTIVALELEKPYPENYQEIVQQVVRENESGFLPPLKSKIDNIQKYELVFLGSPTWGMKLPPPIKSFLSQYNLSGKTVVPFNTNGGYGIGTSFETIKELCPNSKILEGFTTSGGREREGQSLIIKDERRQEAAREVKQWLTKIKLVRGS